MIPKINLDDRTFDDIFNDCLKLIPRYCPEWTNHNTSDPGIALLELFSWMTEMTIYRLNKVPEKTYLSLLELMGLSLVTPQSARAIVQFFPVEGIRRTIDVKAGTKIAATVSDSEDIIFETEKNIKINNVNLVSCVNRFKEETAENVINQRIREFSLFESKNSVEHILYLKSDSFKYLEFEHFVQVEVIPVKDIVHESDQLVKHLFWEYWDGEKWSMMDASSSVNNFREKNDVIYLHGNIPIQSTSVNDEEGYWIRAVLSDIPEEESSLSVREINLKTIFGGRGFSPDYCLSKNNSQYLQVDMNSSFKMFSDSPEYNEAFYISADEILKNKTGRVEFSYFFSETNVEVEENKNALFIYEYWNGSDWLKISDENEFHDGTLNLKKSGSVSFVIPNDISVVDVNNEEHFWIRVRLVTKDFAIGGVYLKDDKDNWTWKFTSKVQTPDIEKIRIKYESLKHAPQGCCTYSNFVWNNLKSIVNSESDKDICLFYLDSNKYPSLYFGFDEKFPAGESSIFFKLDENSVVKDKNKFDDFHKDSLMYKKFQRQVSLRWEYFDGVEWKKLTVNDNTDCFYESGFVDFAVPEDMEAGDYFGKNLFWIRVSLVSGSFENNPFIKDILLNSVYVRNEKTYENEILGSGSGAPGQSCFVAHTDILKGSELYVDEGSVPSANEIQMIRNDVDSEPYFIDGDKVWVRYKEVENFYSSNAFSRHYVVDYSNGKIQFGDGAKGLNPPKGKFNIMMKKYHTGGGSNGNVAKNTIQVLLQGIPFVSGCTNPFPAEGGADMEKIDNLKSRAAGSFKSLQRAVTAEDFQWLAREASSSVGRAFCLGERNSKNEVCTVIVPVRPKGFCYSDKLIPSRELIRRVKDYLDERKIVGTPICVQGPIYKDFDISLALIFKSNVIDEGIVKQKIDGMLRKYFDCLDGDDGSGWPCEKEISVGGILKQLEKVNEILSVSNVELFDLDANVKVEKILLKKSELPYLRNLVIEMR